MQLMEKVIISGKVVERYTYRAREFNMPRGKKRYASSPAKLNANYRNAVKRLTRLINCNFTAGDLLLTLSYDNENLPSDLEAAKRDLDNFMRRLKRSFKKLTERDLKYITTTSDKKSDSDDLARIHHHIIIERMDYDVMIKLWGKGDINYRLLNRMKNYKDVAGYIIKNSRGKTDDKKWSSSRNLKKPIELPPRPINRKGEFRIPKGCKVVERHTYENDITGQSEYVMYIDERDETEKGREKKATHKGGQ